MAEPKAQIERRTWDDFRAAGLLWWVNRMLHLFGWAIVTTANLDGEFAEAFPAIVPFRGFTPDNETDGFAALTATMKQIFGTKAARLGAEAWQIYQVEHGSGTYWLLATSKAEGLGLMVEQIEVVEQCGFEDIESIEITRIDAAEAMKVSFNDPDGKINNMLEAALQAADRLPLTEPSAQHAVFACSEW